MSEREVVLLEGGELDGQTVELSAMSQEAVDKYVLTAAGGVYRHDAEVFADFRDGRRVATFVPDVPT